MAENFIEKFKHGNLKKHYENQNTTFINFIKSGYKNKKRVVLLLRELTIKVAEAAQFFSDNEDAPITRKSIITERYREFLSKEIGLPLVYGHTIPLYLYYRMILKRNVKLKIQKN